MDLPRRLLVRLLVWLGLRKPPPAYLMKGEISDPVQPPPRPQPSAAAQLRQATQDARL